MASLVVNKPIVEIEFLVAPIATIDLSCYTVAFELTPSTEDIDVGTFCDPSKTDVGRTTYTAVLSMLWEPALYTALEPHLGQIGQFRMFLTPGGSPEFLTFDTRFVAQAWGRFEVGQRVEVDLPLGVLTTPSMEVTVPLAQQQPAEGGPAAESKPA